MRSVTSLATLLLAAALPAQASIVFPKAFATVEGPGTSNSPPFSVASARYMQNAWEGKGSAFVARSISFRRDGSSVMRGTARVVEAELRFGEGPDPAKGSMFGAFDKNWQKAPTLVVARKKIVLPDWSTRPKKAPAPFNLNVRLDRPYAHLGTSPFLWELKVFSNTVGGASYPTDFYRGLPGVHGNGRDVGFGCRRNMKSVGQLVATVSRTRLTLGTTSACPNAPGIVLLGATDPNANVGLCAPLRSSAEVLFALPGLTDRLGNKKSDFLFGAWNPAWSGIRVHLQALCLGASGLVLGAGRQLTFPSTGPTPQYQQNLAAALSANVSIVWDGGLVFRIDG